ncbi:MAG: nitronate monooxygenase [Burkholderiales bacterium]|nr:nitronate monooxygenase [Burkholderiales bacterium]
MPVPFDMRLPVIAAPMFLVSGPELVLAACRAGIGGAFPTPNARPIDVLEQWMRQITEGLAAIRRDEPGVRLGPWAANLVTHSSNQRLPQDLELIARYQPPLVITALGSPKPAIDVVHGYGGRVIADVVNLTLARKAVAAGADGLACVSAGAGGHTGHLSPFAFVSAVRQFFDGLVIIGGGIADGAGVAGAIACGADLVYMGTRFIATAESMAPPAYKQMLVDAGTEDVVISDRITGTPASWLVPSLRAAGIDLNALPEKVERNYNSNRSIEESRRWKDLWAAGQGVGLISAVEPVQAVVARLEDEYLAAARRFAAQADAAPRR